MRNSKRGKCSSRDAHVLRDASIRIIFPVQRWMRGLFNVLFEPKSFLILLICFKKLNPCTSYLKQIMNVLIGAMEQIFSFSER